MSRPTPRRIIETSLYVKDLDRAGKFYTEVLGLEVVTKKERRHLFLKAGKSMLLLFQPETTSSEQDTPHGAKGEIHFALEIERGDLERWKQTLLEQQVPIESEVTWPNSAKSIYFRDPDRNSVELVTPGLWPIEG